MQNDNNKYFTGYWKSKKIYPIKQENRSNVEVFKEDLQL
jgi:hypothetical protein